MRFLRFVLVLLILMGSLFAAARLPVLESARLVTTSLQVIEGRVTREFWSGDYLVESSGRVQLIATERVGAIAYEAVTFPAWVKLGGWLVLGAICVLLSFDLKALFEWMQNDLKALRAEGAVLKRQRDLERSVREAIHSVRAETGNSTTAKKA